ncbi:MAG: DNA adenine methylase [Salinispira sp.]
MSKKIKRSHLFYVGDKYRLMKQLLDLFPAKVDDFYEPFSGGGTVFLNVEANKYFLNDIIHTYRLSHSYKKDIVPDSLKKEFKKTYYAKFNKEGYEKLRIRVNMNTDNDPLILYILLIYGFNRMLRFNGGGKFNLPVGNVDFNKNVVNALNNYFDFVYLDPPYLITSSEYNKLWSEKEETDLLNVIEKLDKTGVKFALSNVTHYNENTNDVLIQWMKKYNVHSIQSNYISYHNNGKKKIKEVLITNY